MKKTLLILLFISTLTLNLKSIYGQDTLLSNPLIPQEKESNLSFGITAGLNLPLAPSILTRAPKTGTATVQKALLNGLDGLGYGITHDIGLLAKYSLDDNIMLAGALTYLRWKSENSCNCLDTSAVSTNILSSVSFSLSPQFRFLKSFYIAPELNFNSFSVKVTEFNSKRGNLDFSKNYFRIGTGLILGYYHKMVRYVDLDLSVKYQIPNLLLAKSFNPSDTESQAILNDTNSTNESLIMILSFNIGILFHF